MVGKFRLADFDAGLGPLNAAARDNAEDPNEALVGAVPRVIDYTGYIIRTCTA